ncbi:RfaG Glycosyltransferase [Candidatus Nanopelagicaceae bacterium]
MDERRVLHLSKISHGGAAIAAKRLNDAFSGTAWASRIIFAEEQLRTVRDKLEARVSNKLDYEIGKIGKSPLTLSLLSRVNQKQIISMLNDPLEIKNVHWFPNFPVYFLTDKVVFTLHDMNQFTGACHHSFSCNNFETNCQACPQVGSIFQKMVMDGHEKKLEKVSKLQNYHVISPSKWLASKARESSIFQHAEISVIPNPVPQEIFSRHQRASIRAKLNLENSFVVGGVGHTFGSKKGGNFTRDVVELLRYKNPDHKIVYITFGQNDYKKSSEEKDINVISGDQVQMAAMLSTCDVFLYASAADNLPSILLEAQSVGVPIISHDIGGISETYQDNVSGKTIANDVFAFCDAAQAFLDNPSYLSKFSSAASSFAQSHFSSKYIASQYIDVYESLD